MCVLFCSLVLFDFMVLGSGMQGMWSATEPHPGPPVPSHSDHLWEASRVRDVLGGASPVSVLPESIY